MKEQIRAAIFNCLVETDYPTGRKFRGKVRDVYDEGDRLVMITTDRLSAFDRALAAIPFKGQVLNLTSVYWFQMTEDIVPNHLLSVPDVNTVVAKKCRVFPVEFVMRGYITGTTSTSLWTQYAKGVRHYCGHDFPEGLRKNQQLEKPVLTPTTKDAIHDLPISGEDIVRSGLMSAADWEEASAIAARLYQRGVEIARSRGLILVDTKYEMGLDEEGQITLIDEIHTPDSSRYWLADTYETRFAAGEEPDNIDKEFLRRWFAANCDPYNDEILPDAPEELIVELSERYIRLYEMITGNQFEIAK